MRALRRSPLPALLLVAVVLSGCASDPPSSTAQVAPEEPAADPWEGSKEQVLLDVSGGGTQFDVLCAFGGGVRMPRADGHVLPGSREVVLTVTAPLTTTGLQLGYLVAESAASDEAQEGITWTETARGGTVTATVPVPPEAVEDPESGALWHFYMRANVQGLEQDCYTGAMEGDFVLRAVAVKG